MSVVLSARDTGVRFGGRVAIEGVDLELSAGEMCVLIGPNGSGKTTLLRAALGHLASTGSIAWLGRALADWRPRDLARTAAYLPQSPGFEPGDRVIDVLRLGRTPHNGWLGLDTDADDAAIADVTAALSLGDLLDRPVDTLSGGQRQRVFLGRALAQQPAALLLDEPATYLDARHQIELHGLLRKLTRERGLAVLMASHDLNLAANHADTAILLKAGKPIASGAMDEVLTENLLSEAFETPMRNVEIDGRRYVVAV